jgi:sterol desaturase/sphingolipid hydroxylase (fatty acid hydroxylase superfamily)
MQDLVQVRKLSVSPTLAPSSSSAGITAVGIFWFFGAIMASYACVTLLWPGTILDRLWKLNTRAHVDLLLMGPAIGILFLVLGAALVAAGIGWTKRRTWGWTLGVILLATQVTGDLLSAAMGEYLRGGAGVLIAGSLLYYLFRPSVKQAFVMPVMSGVPQR